jgi:hypothetical protein
MDLLESEVFSRLRRFTTNGSLSVCSSSLCASVLSGLSMGQHHIMTYPSSEVFREAVFRLDKATPSHAPWLYELRVEFFLIKWHP